MGHASFGASPRELGVADPKELRARMATPEWQAAHPEQAQRAVPRTAEEWAQVFHFDPTAVGKPAVDEALANPEV